MTDYINGIPDYLYMKHHERTPRKPHDCTCSWTGFVHTDDCEFLASFKALEKQIAIHAKKETT